MVVVVVVVMKDGGCDMFVLTSQSPAQSEDGRPYQQFPVHNKVGGMKVEIYHLLYTCTHIRRKRDGMIVTMHPLKGNQVQRNSTPHYSHQRGVPSIGSSEIQKIDDTSGIAHTTDHQSCGGGGGCIVRRKENMLV